MERDLARTTNISPLNSMLDICTGNGIGLYLCLLSSDGNSYLMPRAHRWVGPTITILYPSTLAVLCDPLKRWLTQVKIAIYPHPVPNLCDLCSSAKQRRYFEECLDCWCQWGQSVPKLSCTIVFTEGKVIQVWNWIKSLDIVAGRLTSMIAQQLGSSLH